MCTCLGWSPNTPRSLRLSLQVQRNRGTGPEGQVDLPTALPCPSREACGGVISRCLAAHTGHVVDECPQNGHPKVPQNAPPPQETPERPPERPPEQPPGRATEQPNKQSPRRPPAPPPPNRPLNGTPNGPTNAALNSPANCLVRWASLPTGPDQGCIGRGGGGNPPPPSRASRLCPATVSMTASASFSGICNRQ